MVSVPLSNGGAALIDDEDVHVVLAHSWCRIDSRRGRQSYAKATINSRTAMMHRLVMGVTDSCMQIDHVNGNGLDNRRGNLRVADNSTNQANIPKLGVRSSRFKGVTWHASACRWQAQLKVRGRNLYLGLFASEEDAARAYDAAALEHFGEFARPNFADGAA